MTLEGFSLSSSTTTTNAADMQQQVEATLSSPVRCPTRKKIKLNPDSDQMISKAMETNWEDSDEQDGMDIDNQTLATWMLEEPLSGDDDCDWDDDNDERSEEKEVIQWIKIAHLYTEAGMTLPTSIHQKLLQLTGGAQEWFEHCPNNLDNTTSIVTFLEEQVLTEESLQVWDWVEVPEPALEEYEICLQVHETLTPDLASELQFLRHELDPEDEDDWGWYLTGELGRFCLATGQVEMELLEQANLDLCILFGGYRASKAKKATLEILSRLEGVLSCSPLWASSHPWRRPLEPDELKIVYNMFEEW